MGVIDGALQLLFGRQRNVLLESAEFFRENAENAGVRGATAQAAAMQQFAAEFGNPRRSAFDAFIDGVNRLPRPMMAMGTLGLMVAAMVDPIWFASRMQGIALVPEPLWWLMGAIVSFYFGARHQAKGQEFQRSIAETMARTDDVMTNISALEELSADAPRKAVAPAAAKVETIALHDNPALMEWENSHGS